MIVVDSSVWIEWFRSGAGELTVKTWRNIDPLNIILGDIVLLELLRGARNEADASKIDRSLKSFPFEQMLGRDIAVDAARHYRFLRNLGVTVRSSADLIIGTYCIRHGHALLQKDRDFLPMAEHLGLKLL